MEHASTWKFSLWYEQALIGAAERVAKQREPEKPTKSLLQLKDYFNCQFLPSEVLSFILDSESLIGIMGNEHSSFKSQTPMSGLAGLEPGNVLLKTPSDLTTRLQHH